MWLSLPPQIGHTVVLPDKYTNQQQTTARNVNEENYKKKKKKADKVTWLVQALQR